MHLFSYILKLVFFLGNFCYRFFLHCNLILNIWMILYLLHIFFISLQQSVNVTTQVHNVYRISQLNTIYKFSWKIIFFKFVYLQSFHFQKHVPNCIRVISSIVKLNWIFVFILTNFRVGVWAVIIFELEV